MKPFIGGGVNYTRFFSTDTSGALAGSELELDDSFGLAVHAGIDFGAAWGAPIARVEVQVDGGPWRPATIDRSEAKFAWSLWSVDWPNAKPGEHTITSRAVDTQGNVQPAMDDARIAKKKTYWESNGQVTRRIAVS